MKGQPRLALPFTVTTTFPVVALAGTGTTIWVSVQNDGIAEVPLKVTELFGLCDPPKFEPLIVIS